MQDIRERTFQFAVRVIQFCGWLEEQRGIARHIGLQLLRSATSVGANCEEAKAGQSRADFVSKYNIALKEAREAHYWLRLLVAADKVPATRLTDLIDEADQIVAILTTIVKKVRSGK